ncbi:MAG: hypothetical protein AAF628_34295, partial [Planctomycetota bacterium]
MLYSGFGSTPPQTWEWDGSGWAQRTPAQSPNNSTDARLAYDVARDRTVLVALTSGYPPAFPVSTWLW